MIVFLGQQGEKLKCVVFAIRGQADRQDPLPLECRASVAEQPVPVGDIIDEIGNVAVHLDRVGVNMEGGLGVGRIEQLLSLRSDVAGTRSG
jgi:hypothetical protein